MSDSVIEVQFVNFIGGTSMDINGQHLQYKKIMGWNYFTVLQNYLPYYIQLTYSPVMVFFQPISSDMHY